MYLPLFEKFRNVFSTKDFTVDNYVFRLHYKITSPLLFVFSVILTVEKILENPIECMETDNIRINLLNSFCWVNPTFSLPEAWNKEVGEEVPYPGVDKYVQGKERVFHAYYQWVSLALFFQSIFFYIPHYVWKTMEGHKMKHLTKDLLNPKENNNEKIQGLVNYLIDSRNQHYWYYAWYFFAEILNLLNVVGQTVLMDKLFASDFSKMVKAVIDFTKWDSAITVNPLVEVFPRVAKCNFYQYGSSGNIQRHDALCVLPLNIYNEKIFIFLWFWFAALIVLSALNVLYRAILTVSCSFRLFVFKQHLCFIDKSKALVVMNNSGCSDWFLLDLLRRNLDPVRYRDIIHRLCRSLDEKNNCSI